MSPKLKRFKAISLAILFVGALSVREARADGILVGSLADAANYAVLYSGTGGNTAHISNVTVNGNIGIGGTGQVDFSGPGTINGRLDFAAPTNTGQYSNNNGANVGPTSANYNQSNVTTDLANLSILNVQLTLAAGTALALNAGNQSLNINTGTLDAFGRYVFTVTSYAKGNGDILTINGDGVHSVVFNFANGLNLGGDVALAGGLNPDMVVWNFGGTGNVQLNNNASSFPNLAFQGIILAPNNAISVVNANLTGRVFGGDSHDLQIVSGDTINAPQAVPEPASMILLGLGLVGAAGSIRRRRNARDA